MNYWCGVNESRTHYAEWEKAASTYLLYDAFGKKTFKCKLICRDKTQISGGWRPVMKGGSSEEPKAFSGDGPPSRPGPWFPEGVYQHRSVCELWTEAVYWLEIVVFNKVLEKLPPPSGVGGCLRTGAESKNTGKAGGMNCAGFYMHNSLRCDLRPALFSHFNM